MITGEPPSELGAGSPVLDGDEDVTEGDGGVHDLAGGRVGVALDLLGAEGGGVELDGSCRVGNHEPRIHAANRHGVHDRASGAGADCRNQPGSGTWLRSAGERGRYCGMTTYITADGSPPVRQSPGQAVRGCG